MAHRLEGMRGRAIYRLRKAIVEPVFGWVKQVLGFRCFILEVTRTFAPWHLVCLALDDRRMAALNKPFLTL